MYIIQSAGMEIVPYKHAYSNHKVSFLTCVSENVHSRNFRRRFIFASSQAYRMARTLISCSISYHGDADICIVAFLVTHGLLHLPLKRKYTMYDKRSIFFSSRLKPAKTHSLHEIISYDACSHGKVLRGSRNVGPI